VVIFFYLTYIVTQKLDWDEDNKQKARLDVKRYFGASNGQSEVYFSCIFGLKMIIMIIIVIIIKSRVMASWFIKLGLADAVSLVTLHLLFRRH